MTRRVATFSFATCGEDSSRRTWSDKMFQVDLGENEGLSPRRPRRSDLWVFGGTKKSFNELLAEAVLSDSICHTSESEGEESAWSARLDRLPSPASEVQPWCPWEELPLEDSSPLGFDEAAVNEPPEAVVEAAAAGRSQKRPVRRKKRATGNGIRAQGGRISRCGPKTPQTRAAGFMQAAVHEAAPCTPSEGGLEFGFADSLDDVGMCSTPSADGGAKHADVFVLESPQLESDFDGEVESPGSFLECYSGSSPSTYMSQLSCHLRDAAGSEAGAGVSEIFHSEASEASSSSSGATSGSSAPSFGSSRSTGLRSGVDSLPEVTTTTTSMSEGAGAGVASLLDSGDVPEVSGREPQLPRLLTSGTSRARSASMSGPATSCDGLFMEGDAKRLRAAGRSRSFVGRLSMYMKCALRGGKSLSWSGLKEEYQRLTKGTPASRCVACLERASSLAFVPCGHRCVCVDCAKNLPMYPKQQCLLCRAEATSLITIFG
eukprot:TRINITY_DN7156_c0_g2_i1.p1 TRINITY_DN7156_c0_g2~~TRINITY_DN7156_c0_g2_i1.p1  ORF type:complete len:489 (+),score=84.08 TRINITY_DN7156_c0_g2_i1:63-1529(+)